MPRGGGESAAQPEAGRWRAVWRRHGRGIQRVATALFLLLVAALLVRQAALVEWQEVGQALAAYSLRVLLLAGLCSGAGGGSLVRGRGGGAGRGRQGVGWVDGRGR